jgi:hypothetical protein
MPISPLNDSHLANIKKSLEIANSALQAAEMAERAGIDVTAQKQSLQDSIQKLLQIKQVYFPNS